MEIWKQLIIGVITLVFLVGAFHTFKHIYRKCVKVFHFILIEWQRVKNEIVDDLMKQKYSLEQYSSSLERRIGSLERQVQWYKLYTNFAVPMSHLEGSRTKLSEVDFDAATLRAFHENIRQLAELNKDISVCRLEPILPIVITRKGVQQ